MPDAATLVARAVLALHSLVHLMRFVAYWPLGTIKGIAYKTSLLGGAWKVGEAGMRTYSVGWLAVGMGFAVAVGALAMSLAWAWPFLVAVTLVSLMATVLDWPGAIIGTVIDLAILAAIYFRLL